jgi:hypothetical protein
VVLTWGNDPEDNLSQPTELSSGSFHVHTTSGLSGMATVTEPDWPPTVAEVSDVARPIGVGGGDVHLVVERDETISGGRSHVILRRFRLARPVQEEDDGGPVTPTKVMSYWIKATRAAGSRAGNDRLIDHFVRLTPLALDI